MDETGEVLLGSATVADVLEFREPDETVELVARKTPVADVIDRLVAEMPPRIIVVTESGAAGQKPITAVNAADLPQLYGGIEGR